VCQPADEGHDRDERRYVRVVLDCVGDEHRRYGRVLFTGGL
jgi:hypothetical protein